MKNKKVEKGFILRRAKKTDWPSIKRRIRQHPDCLEQKDLPHWSKFFVYTFTGKVVACVAADLIIEVRSLSVDPAFEHLGLGGRLTQRCEAEAIARRIRQTMLMTDKPKYFRRFGYVFSRGNRNAMVKSVRKNQNQNQRGAR